MTKKLYRCKQCGGRVLRRPSRVRKTGRIFCSKRCLGKFLKILFKPTIINLD